MSKQVSRTIAGLPISLSHFAANSAGLVNEKVRTALDMRHLVDRRTSAVREFLDHADHIVVVCNWIREVLRRNGVSNSKMTLSRQGLPHPAANVKAQRRAAGNPLRLVFVGRLHKTKGVEFLAEAVAKALATDYGIAPARLAAKGLASYAPVASNRDDAGKARNRRVELVEQ